MRSTGFAMLLFVACSGRPSGNAADYLVTQPGAAPAGSASDRDDEKDSDKNDKDTRPDDDDEDLDPSDSTAPEPQNPTPAPEPVPGAVTYKGTLAASPTVNFGGSPHCSYSVTMTNIEVQIAVTDHVASAMVKNVRVEKVRSGTYCSHGPAAPSRHDYTYAEVADAGAPPAAIVMSGAEYNHPKSRLTLEAVKKGEGYEVKLVWKRDDGQPAKLGFTVTATVSLTKG